MPGSVGIWPLQERWSGTELLHFSAVPRNAADDRTDDGSERIERGEEAQGERASADTEHRVLRARIGTGFPGEGCARKAVARSSRARGSIPLLSVAGDVRTVEVVAVIRSAPGARDRVLHFPRTAFAELAVVGEVHLAVAEVAVPAGAVVDAAQFLRAP